MENLLFKLQSIPNIHSLEKMISKLTMGMQFGQSTNERELFKLQKQLIIKKTFELYKIFFEHCLPSAMWYWYLKHSPCLKAGGSIVRRILT